MILSFLSLQSAFSARTTSPALCRVAGCRVVRSWLCLLLLQMLAWPVLAAEDNKPEERLQENHDWVEETINPKTEWVEEIFTPFNRWVERKIQGKPAQPEAPVLPPADVFSHRVNPPANAISPQEAGRLLRLLYPGDILRIHFEPGPPPYYLIKLLGSKGNIASYYIHAIDGTLLDTVPFAADSVPAQQNKAQGEQ